MTVAVRRTLDSLTVPNYRRYFAGQIVSITGNWMQMVAEAWLIVSLTHSGAALGITVGLQFLPILLLGALGGVFVDRHDKRRLLMVTQTLMAIPALALWGLTGSGVVEVWMVYALVLARGVILAIDNPARQTFVMELVGPDKVVNAVSLNSVIIHTARIAGPMFAGGLIAFVGVAPCFLFNSLSFAAMLIALYGMDVKRLITPERAPREPGQVRAAIAEVRANPNLKIPLAMMAVIGTLAFNFQVLLPLFAKFTWHGTATTYAVLMAGMGVGSIAGALISGFRGSVTSRLLVGSAAVFGVAQLGAAVAPTELVQLLVLAPVGAASVTFAAGVNSSLQLAAGAMRGRVMALYSVVFLGSTPIGAPIVGALAESFGPRWGLVLGGLATLATAGAAALAYRRVAALALAEPTSSESWTCNTTSSSCGSSEARPRATRRETSRSVAPTAAR
ncbi:MAG: MFS transporter [Solirubrobacteraceae bacterium]